MKVLCNFTPCGPSHVRSGWGRVFKALGHEFYFWDPSRKPAFDAFSEVEPDLYLGCTYEVDRAVFKNIAKRPGMRVLLFASAWGPYLKDVDLRKYPIVVASEEEKRTIERLKRETGRPDAVFIHAHAGWLEGTMSGWGEIGVRYAGILNAADTFVYLDGKKRPELECDLGFVGGYWGYKARNIDRFLLPLCHPGSGLRVKIFGNQPWPVHQYLGTCSDEDARDLFASAAVCPNVSEPHSTDLGWDVVERPFKVLAAGGFCLSDWVDEAEDLFGADELPMAEDPEDFRSMFFYYLANPELRAEVAARGRRKVLTEHTYFDRVHDFFELLGMERECARVLALKGELLKGEA